MKYNAISNDKFFSNKAIQSNGKEKFTLMEKENRKFVTKQSQIKKEENGKQE